MSAQCLRLTRSSGLGLLWGVLLWFSGCSTPQAPPPNPDAVRQHADKAFQQLHAQEQPQAHTDAPSQIQPPAASDQPSAQLPSSKAGIQIPLATISQSDDDGYVRAIGYGSLAKGLYLCQHSADLAARVELSKLIRVKVTERSTDRIRERTGKEAEQDIEILREGLVNEVLADVRIVERKVDKDAGTCSSTAMIPKKNLSPTPVSGSDANVNMPR
jgi:hypothetical protein